MAETRDDPAAWPDVLDEIKQAVSASHMLIAERDATGRLILGERPWEQPFLSGQDGETGGRRYIGHYWPFDAWGGFAAGGRCEGPVLVSHTPGHIVPDSSESHDWLRPLDIDEYTYLKLFDTSTGWVGVNIHFQRRTTDTTRVHDFLRLIQRPLAKHVRAAFSGVRSAPRSGPESRMSVCAHPQFLLAPDGRIKRCNIPAEALAAGDPGLLRRNGVLAFNAASVNRRFRAALAAVIAAGQPEILAVPWPEGRGIAEVLLTPGHGANDPLHAPCTCVLVTFIARDHPAPLVAPLARAHALNATETAILHEADRGRDNKGIARALGLSDVHVRKTLSEIYAKLGGANRHELAALIARLHRAMR